MEESLGLFGWWRSGFSGGCLVMEKMGYLVVYLLLTFCFDGLREVFLGGFDGGYGVFSPEI